MILLFRLLIQDLKPHMVGAFEDFGRQTASPQGQGNFLLFENRFATNPHLVPGWGVGVYIDSCINPSYLPERLITGLL